MRQSNCQHRIAAFVLDGNWRCLDVGPCRSAGYTDCAPGDSFIGSYRFISKTRIETSPWSGRETIKSTAICSSTERRILATRVLSSATRQLESRSKYQRRLAEA